MKQIIKRDFPSGFIICKYYINDRSYFHGLYIRYYINGNLCCKTNCINHKRYGLNTDYYYEDAFKIKKQKYHL